MAELSKILVSACLVGNRVRYNARDVPCGSETLAGWLREGRVVPLCPEVAGGLPVPRPPAEIANADGKDVIEGSARVFDNTGRDVTGHFLEGARRALATARQHDVKIAVLKEKSPSCGSSLVYDGTFSGTANPGRGVTTAILEANGIRVFSEHEIEEAAKFLEAFGSDWRNSNG